MTRLHNELDLGAYWLPFTANRAFKAKPRLVVSASGTRYRTDDGRELLDGMSGLWCCNAGHSHPRIVEAIRAQAADLDYATAFQVGHPTVFRLAERLAAMAPADLNAVFFTNSGSESVDTALKIALAYHHARGEPSRTRFVGREAGLPRCRFRRHERWRHRQQPQGVRSAAAGCCPPAPDNTTSNTRRSAGASQPGAPTWPMSWNGSSRSTTRRPSPPLLSNRSRGLQGSWCRRWAIWNGYGRLPPSTASCSYSTR